MRLIQELLEIRPHGLMSIHKTSPQAKTKIQTVSPHYTYFLPRHILPFHVSVQKSVCKCNGASPVSLSTIWENLWEFVFQGWSDLGIGKRGTTMLQISENSATETTNSSKILGQWSEILNEKIFQKSWLKIKISIKSEHVGLIMKKSWRCLNKPLNPPNWSSLMRSDIFKIYKRK